MGWYCEPKVKPRFKGPDPNFDIPCSTREGDGSFLRVFGAGADVNARIQEKKWFDWGKHGQHTQQGVRRKGFRQGSRRTGIRGLVDFHRRRGVALLPGSLCFSLGLGPLVGLLPWLVCSRSLGRSVGRLVGWLVARIAYLYAGLPIGSDLDVEKLLGLVCRVGLQ